MGGVCGYAVVSQLPLLLLLCSKTVNYLKMVWIVFHFPLLLKETIPFYTRKVATAGGASRSSSSPRIPAATADLLQSCRDTRIYYSFTI